MWLPMCTLKPPLLIHCVTLGGSFHLSDSVSASGRGSMSPDPIGLLWGLKEIMHVCFSLCLVYGCVCVYESLSFVQLFCDPMDCSPPAPLCMGFSRQEYWSGLPCPSPGNLPDLEIKPMSPALQVDSLPSEPPENFSTWQMLAMIMVDLVIV